MSTARRDSGAAERESDQHDLMFPFQYEYLWHLARCNGFATSRELADRYGAYTDWRRGNGRAASNTMRSLRRRGLVEFGDGIWELTGKGWLVVQG
jgi:hypothetical protein